MHYHIKRRAPLSQFIEITLHIQALQGEMFHFQMASWRPGRYELANYAQNVRNFSASIHGNPTAAQKISKDCWEIIPAETGELIIQYEYFCNQLDAGGCWSDDQQLYLNFSNCTFAIPEKVNESIHLTLDIPTSFKIACALPLVGNKLIANNYQELMDSPLIASATIQKFSFTLEPTEFHVWIQGEIFFDIQQFLQTIKSFSEIQIKSFGEFPTAAYHFLFQILPFKHYHGVEHKHSTVITFGPDESLQEANYMQELIGVSAHELYHAWNVCRIRPIGLCPYDLSKEVYLSEGLVLEGITTYMGDLLLMKSSFFSLPQYLQELRLQIQKETESFGWRNQSIVESSWDLWLDGYKSGIPHKKVNIYNRGSLISLCLDICLIQQGSSLQSLMRELWCTYGKLEIAYTWEEFLVILKKKAHQSTSMEIIIEELILGRNDILPYVSDALHALGITLQFTFEQDIWRHQLGIILDSTYRITIIHPDSDALEIFMLKDQVLNWELDEEQKILNCSINRNGRKLTLKYIVKNAQFFPYITLVEKASTHLREQWFQLN